MKKFILSFLISFSLTPLFAQLPNTDIWLLDINVQEDSVILSNPINITNRAGYDNQPAFSPDGSYILYTSIRDEKQSDIYKYDLKTKQITQFTNTATSEYSPTFMPDGKNISVVMVEPDSTQRLWKFPLSGTKSSLVKEDLDSVGYHCWFSDKRWIAFLISEPSTMFFITTGKGAPKFIDRNVGRCLRMHQGMLFYTKKTEDKKNKLYSFNLPGWYIKEDFNTFLESEDFDFINDNIISGKNSFLCKTSIGDNKNKIILDLSSYGIKNITRLAISPDGKKMAIVAE